MLCDAPPVGYAAGMVAEPNKTTAGEDPSVWRTPPADPWTHSTAQEPQPAPLTAAVVAVLLPREHLPYIRDWCQQHCDAGFSVVLYDNSGSVGSLRQTSTFHPNWRPPAGFTKSGAPYGEYTADLSDGQVSQELLAQVAGLPVTVIPWRPRDSSGTIVHGQVEAYVDFIRRASPTIRWAAFIDADEYLTSGAGLSWPELLEAAESAGYSRIVLAAETFEERWSAVGAPRPLAELRSCGEQLQGNKNLVRIDAVERADIHWSWKMTTSSTHVVADDRQYFFRHYNGKSAAAPRFTELSAPLRTAVDESIAVWPVQDGSPERISPGTEPSVDRNTEVPSALIPEGGPVACGGWNRTERTDGVDLWRTNPAHVIRLDALSTVVYELCDGRTETSLVNSVAALFNTQPDLARPPVLTAISSLLAAGIVL